MAPFVEKLHAPSQGNTTNIKGNLSGATQPSCGTCHLFAPFILINASTHCFCCASLAPIRSSLFRLPQAIIDMAFKLIATPSLRLAAQPMRNLVVAPRFSAAFSTASSGPQAQTSANKKSQFPYRQDSSITVTIRALLCPTHVVDTKGRASNLIKKTNE